ARVRRTSARALRWLTPACAPRAEHAGAGAATRRRTRPSSGCRSAGPCARDAARCCRAARAPRRPAPPSCSSAARRRRERRAVAPSALGEQFRHANVAWCALDMPLVPERERKQPPELAAEILASGDVVVEQPVDDARLEVALAVQRFRRERLARERLQLAAQPCCGGDREAPLLPAHDLARQQRLRGLTQQHLLREAAHLVPRWQSEREV